MPNKIYYEGFGFILAVHRLINGGAFYRKVSVAVNVVFSTLVGFDSVVVSLAIRHCSPAWTKLSLTSV